MRFSHNVIQWCSVWFNYLTAPTMKSISTWVHLSLLCRVRNSTSALSDLANTSLTGYSKTTLLSLSLWVAGLSASLITLERKVAESLKRHTGSCKKCNGLRRFWSKEFKGQGRRCEISCWMIDMPIETDRLTLVMTNLCLYVSDAWLHRTKVTVND